MPPTARELRNRGFVLTKGWHDSGALDGVFGPFTEAEADWLLETMCGDGARNWQKFELQRGPWDE